MIDRPSICLAPVKSTTIDRNGKVVSTTVSCQETTFSEVQSFDGNLLGYQCRLGHVHGQPDNRPRCKMCGCRSGHVRECPEWKATPPSVSVTTTDQTGPSVQVAGSIGEPSHSVEVQLQPKSNLSVTQESQANAPSMNAGSVGPTAKKRAKRSAK